MSESRPEEKNETGRVYQLKHPFTVEGTEVATAEVTRRPVVRDRIKARQVAVEVLADDGPDSMLLGVLAQVAVWGEGKKGIPAQVLADKLDYEDFVSLNLRLGGRDFSSGPKATS